MHSNLVPIHNIKPTINLLLYANDILILSKAIVDNAHSIKTVMQLFEANIGLVINDQKSNLFFSKGAKNKILVIDIIKVNTGNLPIIYLLFLYLTINLKLEILGLL